jgi:hypothetical protein
MGFMFGDKKGPKDIPADQEIVIRASSITDARFKHFDRIHDERCYSTVSFVPERDKTYTLTQTIIGKDPPAEPRTTCEIAVVDDETKAPPPTLKILPEGQPCKEPRF